MWAVLWQRDGRDWQFQSGLTAEALAGADREMEQKQLAPVDLAPYLDGTELRYAVLWCGADAASNQDPAHSRPVVEVGLKLDEFQKKLAGELAPSVLQVASDPIDSSPRVAVIWHKKRAREDVALTLGGESNLASDAAKYADRTALDIGLFSAGAVKGKRDQATEDIERLSQQLTQKPDDSALLRARGMAAVHLGRDQQAVEDLSKALEKNPDDVLGRHFLAVAQARLGNSEAATTALEEIARLAGDRPQGAYSRAVVQSILGNEQEALAALEDAVKEHASDSGYLYDAACAYALIAEHLSATASETTSATGGGVSPPVPPSAT